MNNVLILEETLQAIKSGGYWVDEEAVFLKLSKERLENAIYLSADKVRELCRCGRQTEKDCFREITFAVLDNTRSQYNYRSFQKYFEDFYQEEGTRNENEDILEVQRRKKEREKYRDKIRGSLLGGAAGDALGYPVEFYSYRRILNCWGEGGIQEYSPDFEKGLALISDDTQMTLFTANGILYGETRGCLRGVQASVSTYVADAYHEWLLTQTGRKKKEAPHCWLLDIPDMHNCRAPGNTCMGSLLSGRTGSVEEPLNHSKGCGGVMRVAPLGLHYGPLKNEEARRKLDQEGAQLAAITHGHPLGYIPAAILTHMVNLSVYGGCERGSTLEDIVLEAMAAAFEIFGHDSYTEKMNRLIEAAVRLAGNDKPDIENIRLLGEGWVAEETLAIAVYCSVRYSHDFSKAIIAAVNHSGDSDSTGAVTGNIVGAWLGYEAIEEKWKKNLELRDILLEMADDLCYGCQMSEYSTYRDPAWEGKYIYAKYDRG